MIKTIIPEKTNKQKYFVKSHIKSNKFKISPYRKVVQFGFLAVTLLIGIHFYIFVYQLENGHLPIVSRPPGVEAFLPISALISLKYWLLTRVFNKVHPSSLILFLIILLTGLFLKKGFCSWVCPFGLLSEYLHKLRKLVFKREFKLTKWVDTPLRSIKYLLLAFFLWAVIIKMDVFSLQSFIYSPYNRVADIKMLKFFTEMSEITFWALTVLVFLSFILPYFWCRYLCPYGALLGFTSIFSVFKITRNSETCIDCGKCNRVCPASLTVDKAYKIHSDECHACLKCVDACPVKDTLYLSAPKEKFRLSGKKFAAAIVMLFIIVPLIARMAGYWQNALSKEEYLYHMQNIEKEVYHHNRGQVPDYQLNDKLYQPEK